MKRKTGSKGFTLLETVFVVVIVVILMVVALPRYTDLIEKAKIKAIQYALGAGSEQVTLVYAKDILANGKPPSMSRLNEILNDKSAKLTKIGVFTVSFTNYEDKGIKVTVTHISAFEMPEGGPFERTIVLVSDG
ncbi:MAG: prepilin-type N-terminal cleavage/methylation domain-containing protein [Smithella sp.]|jgi:prepilin-type N-terminal cleavage/methylation domain-containing protein|nr:prepilin-type N-terminal cleavage/methylation domain-containing protein [Smithellaceae bacterium]NLA42209.1 prepilin-type N-terminal cleavage/methylation domain-containing protein [Smithella sp.]